MVAAATGAADGAAMSVLTIDRRLIGVVARTIRTEQKSGVSVSPAHLILFLDDEKTIRRRADPSSLSLIGKPSTSSIDPNLSATLFAVKIVDRSGGREDRRLRGRELKRSRLLDGARAVQGRHNF